MTAPAAPAVASGGPALHAAWCRHRGNFRHNNEDTVLVVPVATESVDAADAGQAVLPTTGAGIVAVVCDGVGGGAAGEVASALAARTFHRALRGMIPLAGRSAAEAVRSAAQSAHEAIREASERDPATEGMGTTMTAVWLAGSVLHAVQVGDSRLYRLRGDTLEQLSADQSLVGRMRRDGALSEDEARQHPLRNIVDQVLGGSRAAIEPEVLAVPIARGDSFLLCSDGLTDALPDRTLARELATGGRLSPAAVVERLLERVLETSGRDNISIILLRTAGSGSWIRGWLATIREWMRRDR